MVGSVISFGFRSSNSIATSPRHGAIRGGALFSGHKSPCRPLGRYDSSALGEPLENVQVDKKTIRFTTMIRIVATGVEYERCESLMGNI